MKILKRRASALFVFGFFCYALTVAGSALAADDKKNEDVLATIGSEVLTRQVFEHELQTFLDRAHPQARQMLETPDGQKQFLTQLADMLVLAEEAKALKLAEKPELKKETDEITVAMLAHSYLQKLVEKAQVTPKDIEDYYNEHQAEFKDSDSYHLHSITVATEEDAKAIKQELSKGGSFQETAKTRSTDNFKGSGGDRGFVSLTEVHPTIAKTLETLAKDQISEPINIGPGQFQLVKQSEKKVGATQPISSVSVDIEKRLSDEAQSKIYEQRVAELKKEFPVKIEESALELLRNPEMAPEDLTKTLLSIDGKPQPISAIAPELERIPPFLRPHIFSGKGLEDFVDQYVARELVRLYVEKNIEQHKKNDPKAVENAARQVALRHLLDQQVTQKVAVDDAELQSFYAKNLDSFKSPAQIMAHHILVEQQEKAEELLKTIADNKETFENVAKKESKCPSGQKGGDLGTFSPGQMVPEFDDAAQTAEIGKVIGPVKTQFGYHLIRVDERKPEGTTPFEEVKEQVREQLVPEKQREALETYLNNLKEKFPVTLHLDRL